SRRARIESQHRRRRLGASRRGGISRAIGQLNCGPTKLAGMKAAKRPRAEVSSRLNAHRRLMLGLVTAGAVAFLLPAILPPAARLAIAWDSAVVVFLMTTWWVVQSTPLDLMQQT